MSASTARKYARTAGVLFLLTMIFGYFGEMYEPSRIIVTHDAAATARNVTEHNTLFRLGFASYLVEAICDVALALILYVLLKPVEKGLSLMAAFFGLVSTALYAVAELFYFSVGIIPRSAPSLTAFTSAQLDTLMLLSLKVFMYGSGIFMVFYGIASFFRGLLIFRSSYFPKFLGALLMLAGLGFIAKTFTLVLAPAYSSSVLLAPMFLAGFSLTIWLLVKGLDVARWESLRT